MESPSESEPRLSAPRIASGGFLMGLANLVPGVSGGTMILALGLYDRFIGAISDVTRLRLRVGSLLFLAWIAVGALAALLGMSGPAVYMVTEHRWAMYSLFVGMTLGGAPELVRMIRPVRMPEGLALFLGFAAMAVFAFGLSRSAVPVNFVVLLGAGALAASSMILPGLSGSYVLLVLGLYDVVIGAVRPSMLREAPMESLAVLLPVGIGAVLGIALLANVLRALLTRRSGPTHAALLGLLLGSVLGLWPFQEPVHPELVDRDSRRAIVALLEGVPLEQVEALYAVDLDPAEVGELTARHSGLSAGELKARANQLQVFRPSLGQVLASLGLFVAGFAITRRLRPREPRPASRRTPPTAAASSQEAGV